LRAGCGCRRRSKPSRSRTWPVASTANSGPARVPAINRVRADLAGVRARSVEVAAGVVDVVDMTTPKVGELMPLRPGHQAEFDIHEV
jgi:hypothetical protein